VRIKKLKSYFNFFLQCALVGYWLAEICAADPRVYIVKSWKKTYFYDLAFNVVAAFFDWSVFSEQGRSQLLHHFLATVLQDTRHRKTWAHPQRLRPPPLHSVESLDEGRERRESR
jgi:hypothetical protein